VILIKKNPSRLISVLKLRSAKYSILNKRKILIPSFLILIFLVSLFMIQSFNQKGTVKNIGFGNTAMAASNKENNILPASLNATTVNTELEAPKVNESQSNSVAPDSNHNSTTNTSKTTRPVINLATGTYTSPQTLTINTGTSGGAIRYTTDGTTPTSTKGVVYSTAIKVLVTTTIKAIHYTLGMTDSEITTSVITINVPKVVTSVSMKKGVASCMYSGSDLSKINNLNVGWFYNWTTKYNANPSQKGNLEYVPMLWGGTSVTTSSIDSLKKGKQSGEYKNLLAFNEPDLGSQANMTVQQAIDLWPKLMDTGLHLGSPATATPFDGWLENFMTVANKKGYRVDFLTLHFYQDFTDPNSVTYLRKWLTDIYAKYKKPIWITEIGTIDINNWGIKTSKPVTQKLADDYMKQVIPMLEGLSFVERYSWFTDNCSNSSSAKYSSLYDASNLLTSEGKIYTGFSSVPAKLP